MNIRKRVPVCVVFFVLAVSALSAQVRNSIAVVKPRLPEAAKKLYLSIAQYADRKNPRYAEYFRSMSKGGRGSGYVSLDAAGDTIVVTARHVVYFADSADIEIRKDNGDVVMIPECPIVYVDDDVDFALVLIPPEKAGTLGADVRPLELADEPPPDGSEVWSAGFAGLEDKPLWQLGKGAVINHRLVPEDAPSLEFDVFIQHTALLDPGCSGGPLLTGDPADPSSFKVVGIDTWMVPGRQNTNLAISLEVLTKAIARIPPEPGTVEEETAVVEAKARELIDVLNNPEWPRALSDRFISMRMVADGGWGVFSGEMGGPAPDTRKPWSAEISGRSPVESLRQFLFYRMHKECSVGVPFEYAGIVKTPTGVGAYRVEVTRATRSFYIHWVKEGGNWHVVMITASPESTQLATAEDLKIPRAYTRISRTPRAFMGMIGYRAAPLVSEFVGRLGCGVGYSYGAFPWLTFGGMADLSAATTPVVAGAQDVLTIIEASGFAHFNLPAGDSGLFLYLGMGASAGVGFGAQGTVFSYAANGGLGLAIVFSESFSISAEMMGRFGFDAGFNPRLESVMMSIYVTFWSP